jgi:hypothetical protein
MTARAPARLLLAIGVTVALGGALTLSAGILAALPALLAFLPLLAGHYVGADRLERLVARRVARRRPPRRIALPRPVRLARPTGGALIAASLAERAPPAPLTA